MKSTHHINAFSNVGSPRKSAACSAALSSTRSKGVLSSVRTTPASPPTSNVRRPSHSLRLVVPETKDSPVVANGREALRLAFAVSRDEEHISLRATTGFKTIELGARAHNYPLLVLARRRQEERARGVANTEAGWIYSDELFDMLAMKRESVNLLLWRAAQCFKKAGLPGDHLIERRLDSRQVRLGVENVAICRA